MPRLSLNERHQAARFILAGVSQSEIAQRLGVAQSTITRFHGWTQQGALLIGLEVVVLEKQLPDKTARYALSYPDFRGNSSYHTWSS